MLRKPSAAARRVRHDRETSLLVWLVLFFVIVFLATVIVLAVLESNSNSASESDKEQLPAIDGDIHMGDPLVFRGARDASRCTAGEHWDAELRLCAPNMHTPSSFEPLIVNGSVPACESFFDSMCGKWVSWHTNQDRTFTYGYMRNQHLVKETITSNEMTPLRKFYQSCTEHHDDYTQDHESRLELKHQLESVLGDFQSLSELPIVLGRLARRGYEGSGLVLSIERHPTQPKLLPLIMWDGLRNLQQSTVEYLLRRTLSITQMSTLQLLDSIQRIMRVAQELERRNAGHFLEDIQDYIQYVQHDFYTVPYSSITTAAAGGGGGGNGGEWLEMYWQSMGGAGLRFSQRQDMWVACKQQYLPWLMGGTTLLDLNDWKAYLQFVVIYNVHEFVPQLPDNVYYRHWDEFGPVGKSASFHHRIRRGGTPTRRRTKEVDCLRVTQAMVPGLVARAFMEKTHLTRQDMDEVRDMVTRILRVYEKNVQNQTTTAWLSDSGREAALRKLRAVKVRVGEPDEWEAEPFAKMISKDRYTHNMGLVRRYRVQRNLALWTRDATVFDRNALAYFAMPLTEVNAYYSGPTNTITVLAGIMMHPFYNPHYNQVSKHAILGSIIGHELGHVLDHHGLRWDEQGSMRSVFSAQDLRAFFNRTECVRREYNNDVASKHCNATLYGNHTLNENLADLTGVHLAYGAYFDETTEGRAAPIGERQYFFMSFAQAWCSSYDTRHTCDMMETDVHAIPEYRVDKTLRNNQEFQRVFGCHEGSRMFKSKLDQCSIYAL